MSRGGSAVQLLMSSQPFLKLLFVPQVEKLSRATLHGPSRLASISVAKPQDCFKP